MTPENILKQLAFSQGFDQVGIARATPADGFPYLQTWLDSNYQGQMDFMPQYRQAYRHPESILKNVRSILMVAYNYKGNDPKSVPDNQARVARYAQGPDYHQLLWGKLNRILMEFNLQHPSVSGRGVVDTTPLLERDFARRAGLGWVGKNTMLIHKKLGSFMLLGALLLDLELAPDPPFETNHCGSCTACLDACPTKAFVAPLVLDARRCISYLTIEHKTDIPDEFRKGIGNWLMGCDICQDVCPWNRKPAVGADWQKHHQPEQSYLDPVEILAMTEDTFRERFKKTAFWRPKRKRIFRNACIVLGNIGNETHLNILQGFTKDPEPLIANAATWAMAEIQNRLSGQSAGQSCFPQA